jgi:hypothetical protein
MSLDVFSIYYYFLFIGSSDPLPELTLYTVHYVN